MFGAHSNLNPNPSIPYAGLLKVDWHLHPPIFGAKGRGECQLSELISKLLFLSIRVVRNLLVVN